MYLLFVSTYNMRRVHVSICDSTESMEVRCGMPTAHLSVSCASLIISCAAPVVLISVVETRRGLENLIES